MQRRQDPFLASLSLSLSLSLATIIMTGTMQPLLAKLGMDGLKDGLVPCQIHVAWCSVDIVEILFLIFFNSCKVEDFLLAALLSILFSLGQDTVRLYI